MYNIVFYEDSNGNCDLRDFLHMMQQKKKRAFYKLVAFLDYLAEKADTRFICTAFPESVSSCTRSAEKTRTEKRSMSFFTIISRTGLQAVCRLFNYITR